MKRILYLLFLVNSLIGIFTNCQGKTIDVANINNRYQLDSIIALLPSENVEKISPEPDIIEITLKGNLTYAGLRIRKMKATLAYEKLRMVNIVATKENDKFLAYLKQQYGKSDYNDPDYYSIELLNEKIVLESYYDEKHEFTSKENPFSIEIFFKVPDINKITMLHEEIPQGKFQTYYSLKIESSSCAYKIKINGIPALSVPDRTPSINNEEIYLNEYMPQTGIQHINVNIFPEVNSEFKKQNDKITTLHSRFRMSLCQQKINDSRKKYLYTWTLTNGEIVKKEGNRSSENVVNFDCKNIPGWEINDTIEAHTDYTLPYINGRDLRQIPDLKQQIYAKYKQLQSAVTDKNTDQLIALLYPYQKTYTTAYHATITPLGLQKEWNFYTNYELDYKQDLTLPDENSLELIFSDDGRLAKLVPAKGYTNNHYMPYITPYVKSQRNYYNTFVAADESGKLQFILQ